MTDADIRHMLIDGHMLYCGGMNGDIRVWNMDTGQRVTTLRGHRGYVGSMVVCGNTLYSGLLRSRDTCVEQ